MKSSTLKDDILPILLVILVALFFAIRPAVSSNPGKTITNITVKAFAPVVPMAATFEDILVPDTDVKKLAPVVPSVADFRDSL